MTTPTSAPDTIATETIAGIQASAAALLGTAVVTLRMNGQPKIPISAAGPFYRALASYPAGAQYLIEAAAGAARAAIKRGLPATAQKNGLTVVAFPLPMPGENGGASGSSSKPAHPAGNGAAALVAFTTPGLRPELRAVVAADLGIPPDAIPRELEPLDPTRVSATLRLLEASLALAAGVPGTPGLPGVRGATEPEARRDRILYTATKALSKALHEEDVLRIVSETFAGILHMDRAIPYLLGNEGWEARTGVSYYGDPDGEPPPLMLDSESMGALQKGEIVTRTFPDRPNAQGILVPILWVTAESRDLVAVVALETAHVVRAASMAERDLALLIARQAALSLRNVRHAMLDRTLARTLQETLQSHFDPAVLRHLIVEEFYRPAAQDALVGGDFYDVFALPDGRVAVLVGDVAGKGLDSAIHTTLARYTLRAYALLTKDPAEVLRLTNEALARFREFRDFLTVALVILDPVNGSLRYASAGHPPTFLFRRGADAIGTLESTGTLLGMMPGLTWESHTHKWGRGDRLLLYTDGISEAHAPGSVEMFETTRIRDIFATHRQAPPREVMEALFREAEAFSEGIMHDDCAMLVVTQPEA